MLGLMGIFWQPALVRDFVIDTIFMFIWTNKNACLLASIDYRYDTPADFM